MSARKKAVSLIALLTATMVAVLAVCFFTLFWLPTSRYTEFCYQLSKSFASSICSQISGNISSDISDLESNLYGFIDEPLIRDRICMDGEDVPNQDFIDLFSEYYDTTTLLYYYISSFDLYVKGSGLHYTTASNSLALEQPFRSKYYDAALQTPASFVWMGIDQKTGLMEVSKILYSSDTFEVTGLLVIRLDPDFILDSFRNIRNLEFSRAYLLAPDGRIVLSTESSLANTYLDENLTTQIRSLSGATQIDANRSTYIVTNLSDYYRRSNFLVMIQIKNEVMTRDVDVLTRNAWIVVAVILFAIVITWACLSVVISRKVKQITAGFSRVEHEDFSGYIRMDSRVTEFATIAEGYNNMLSHLNHLIEDVYNERLISNEMRLKSLAAQINPHFLFNTLQLISLKSYGDAAKVETIIGHLSRMLEHSLDNRNAKYVRLADELEYLRSYLFIIQCKFEDKIVSQIDVPPDLLDCWIPSCTLQPLIENAVMHGLAPKFGQGHVSLRISRDGNSLQIVIEDDGEGLPPEQVKSLMSNSMADERTADKIGHHMAIVNIRNRLAILYGSNYRFDIKSRLYLGTTVTLQLPCQEEASDD